MRGLAQERGIAEGGGCARVLVALSLLGAASAHGQDAPLSIRAGVLSALVVRGLQLSDPGVPVILGGVDGYGPTGWSASASAMAVRSLTESQAGGWTLRLRRDWSPTEDWTLALGVRHDGYVGDAFLRSWCYNQLDATATYGDLWNATASWRPNGGPGCEAVALGKPTFAVDVNAQWPLVAGVGVDAGAGRLFDGGAASYDYGQWGVFAARDGWSFHLGRTQTHGVATALYGDLGRPRWVASAVWQF